MPTGVYQRESHESRFNRLQIPEPMSGCFLWLGPMLPKGYGQIGKHVYAHRFAWEREHGPIPTGALVRHTCDNPSCVNVAHLRLGDHAANIADRVRRRRSAVGEKNGSARLTEENVRQIRLSAGTERAVSVSKRFGINRNYFYDIVNRKTWAHL